MPLISLNRKPNARKERAIYALKMAQIRARHKINQISANIHRDSHEAVSMDFGQHNLALVKVKTILNQENLIRAHEDFIFHIETIQKDFHSLDGSLACPHSLLTPLQSALYCCGKIDIPELENLCSYCEAKYGKAWVKDAHTDSLSLVHHRLIDYLQYKDFDEDILEEKLHELHSATQRLQALRTLSTKSPQSEEITKWVKMLDKLQVPTNQRL